MEIIMKVKCSASPGAGSSPHSTLKIVDHHRQLQQHTYANSVYKSNTPPHNVISTRTYNPNTHQQSSKYPIAGAISSSCNDYSLGYCCNMPSCCLTTPSTQYSQTPPLPPSISSASFHQAEQYSNNLCDTVDEPEFVSIDDEKVKQYLIRLGQQQLQKQQQQQRRQQVQKCLQREPKITHVFSTPTNENALKPVVYEIIELDDEVEREKLKQIKQQAEQSIANNKLTPKLNINFANRNTKSLDISLIPKISDSASQTASQKLPLTAQQTSLRNNNSNHSNHKIIAEIDLLESDDDDGDDNDDDDNGDDDDGDSYMNDDNEDDDGTLPLVAVSCELQCDDEDEGVDNTSASFSENYPFKTNSHDTQRHQPSMRYTKPSVEDVVIVGSDEDKSHNDNLLVRWEEYEGQRERVFFECFLCGKKVQSSYNLRRHMMIHTGERPFGCDLCDRRFREFSDLKKHRRRHSNEPNFKCMVCHQRKPVENDPTRCINCCTPSKNAVIMAAMKLATDADNAANNNARIQSTNVTKPVNKTTQPASIALPSKSSQQRTLPTITSVQSYNVAATKVKSPPRTNTPSGPSVTTATTDSSAPPGTNSKSSENTQRLLDNIPAVHRPGYNELGMITRKEFPCPLCNRAFGTRHNLKRHYMIHTGEKPFSCSKCRKPFREYSTLKKHMVTHIRERWYKCMRCPVKFRDFLKYTEHKETHLNDSDNDEQPTASNSSTNTKYAFMHVDGYMDSNDEDSGPEDWLECCECGQRFNEIDAYNEHLKEHDTNAHIFQCYICKQQFKSRSELDEHLKQQHRQDADGFIDNDNGDEHVA